MATPIFTIPTGTVNYPQKETGLIFGSDFAHSEYAIPMAMFTFFDSTGNDSSAPTIYIRLSGAFNTTLSNPYQETTGIFGSVTPGSNRDAASIGGITKLIGSMFDAGGTALQSSILKSLGAGGGFLASGGQSGKSQVEFLTRKVFNSFQQLIYQGPKFRAFQLPFNMKPTSYAEAQTLRDIIQTFRIASSPRASGATKLEEGSVTTKSKAEQDAFDEANKDKADDDKIIEFTVAGANELFVDSTNSNASAPLTFGYPDMCKLELILYHSNGGVKLITPVFKSDFCMIENVVLDYGASNKMVFLSNPASVAAGDYFPSEINMTISLRESVLVTAEYASGQNGPGITIF
jgi:hypothetical protein